MVGFDPYGEFDPYEEAGRIAYDYVARHERPLPPSLASVAFEGNAVMVGWSQPPRPADVIVSFNPSASKRDQARAVLYDYYHDDPLRYWSDNEAVKRCFIGGSDPRKENHDPLLLISAYENPKHKVWSCQGTGMSWKEMNDAVQKAIAHRKKLGPLPKSTYDKYPIVIYYYDNDKMKRITYPGTMVPEALDANNNRWWASSHPGGGDSAKAAGLEDIHTRETDDPKKIAAERAHPGWVTKAQKEQLKKQYSWISDMESGSAGDWQSEGPTYDKDVAGTGVIGSITGAIMALVSAVLDATGFGAALGVPLAIATPFVVAAINATDTALHAGDFGAALANLGPALIQASMNAAAKSSVNIPPAALKALGTTVSSIASSVQAGQKKKLDFGQIWQNVTKKAHSFSKIGDAQAEAIATMLGGPGGKGSAAGHVFVQGYLAGKFLDMPAIEGISKILKGYATFADPRIINIALLGMGIGYLSKAQQGGGVGTLLSNVTHTSGVFAGQVILTGADVAKEELDLFVQEVLMPRYGIAYRDPYSVSGPCAQDDRANVRAAKELLQVWAKSQPGILGIVIAPNARGISSLKVSVADVSSEIVRLIPHEVCGVPVEVIGGPVQTMGDFSGYGGYYAGEEPLPDYSALSRGCPAGMWWDSLRQTCRAIPQQPVPMPR